MAKRIKTVSTKYIVKADNEYLIDCSTLKRARQFVKDLPFKGDFKITITKECVTEQVLDSYTYKTTTVLVASELDNDLTID